MTNKKSVLTLAPLFLVIVIDTMGFGLIIPIVSPLFMTKTGGILSATASLTLRDFLYGLSIASFSAVMLFGAPFLGDLSDYLGRKKVLVLALLGTGISLAISGLGIVIHSVTLLIIGRCAAGFAAGSQPIAQAAIADVSSHENKAINMGLMIFMACIGFIIGPIIGGYFANPEIVSWFNYATPFFVAALLAILNAVCVVFTFKETFYPKHKKKLQLTKGLMTFVTAFTHSKIRPLAIAFLIMQIGFSIYFVFLSIFMVQIYHFSTIRLGHLMAYLGVTGAITFTLIIRLATRYLNLEKIASYSLALTVLGLCGLLWPAQWAIWLCAAIIGVGNGLTYTAMLAILSNAVESESQGWIMGVTSAVVAAAWGIGSLLAGALGAFHLDLPFASAALLTFIALLLFLFRKMLEIQNKNSDLH